MQDLSKIEQEYLQANDVGDFQFRDVTLTKEFADNFSKELYDNLMRAAGEYFEASGMHAALSIKDVSDCVTLLSVHISDAIGDMPIWDIVKRGEA